ncbi:hypothetical protein STEG23_028103, partial [Scotinomys teguina]
TIEKMNTHLHDTQKSVLPEIRSCALHLQQQWVPSGFLGREVKTALVKSQFIWPYIKAFFMQDDSSCVILFIGVFFIIIVVATVIIIIPPPVPPALIPLGPILQCMVYNTSHELLPVDQTSNLTKKYIITPTQIIVVPVATSYLAGIDKYLHWSTTAALGEISMKSLISMSVMLPETVLRKKLLITLGTEHQ